MNLKNLVYGATLATAVAAGGCITHQENDQENCQINTTAGLYYNANEVINACKMYPAQDEKEIKCLIEATRGEFRSFSIVCDGWDDRIKDTFNNNQSHGEYIVCSDGELNAVCGK